MFSKKKTLGKYSQGKGRASDSILIFVPKMNTLKKYFEGKGWTKANNQFCFLKRKLQKNIPREMAGQGRILLFLSKKKVLKKYSQGKGWARANNQICFLQRKL